MSLYGGLIIILRLVTPFFIDLLLKFKEQSIFTNSSRQKFMEWICKLNLFKKVNERTENDIKQQRIITRIYLTLLSGMNVFVLQFISSINFIRIGSIYLLLLFNAFKVEAIIQTVSNPSLITYNELHASYVDTLKCSCSVTAIPYEAFTSLSASLHQICSSDLVSDRWISILKSAVIIDYYDDWRNKAYSEFRLLSRLCQLADKTIDDAIHQFLFQYFIASNMITENDFNIQMNVTFSQFTNSLLTYFNALLDTVSLTNQVDQPLMGVVTNTLSGFQSSLTIVNGDIVNQVLKHFIVSVQ